MRTPPSFHCWAAVLLLAATAPAQDWFPRASRMVPPIQGNDAMAWDPIRGTTLLLGRGEVPTSATWEWNGEGWVDVTPPSPSDRPLNRSGAAMATHMGRGRILLHGGGTPSGASSETWEWDGASWTRLQPPIFPPGRGNHAMADGPGGRMVLFGGDVSVFPHYLLADDTWEWDGVSWTRAAPAASPAAREGHAMAMSPRGTVLLFGGRVAATLLGDTWEWNGATWRQLFPAASPPPRRDHSMVFDAARQKTVLFGGMSATAANDTWEWDGTNWLRMAPARSPPLPPSASGMPLGPMAYDVRRHTAVLLAAEDLAGQTVGRTWEYGFPSFYETFGQGCPGSAGRPMLVPSLAPALAGPFSVVLARLPPGRPGMLLLGTSRTRLGALPLPLDLGPAGLPGCLLYTSAEAAFPIATSGPEGVVVWSAGVPSDRSLLNVLFYNQAFFADPGTNPAAMTATNAGQGAVGL